MEAQRNYNKFCFFIFALFFAGCSFSFTHLEFNRGKEAESAQNYKEAVQHYRRVILRAPDTDQALDAARAAARISFFETKNFSDASQFYGHLINYSKNEMERRESQKKIAEIFFEKLTDYPRAIEEFNKLLLLRNANVEAVEYKFSIAKAYFYLNQFNDAQVEIEGALKIVDNDEKKFDLLLFLGNVYFNNKRVEEALKMYISLIKSFPERAKKDNIAMNVIVCYEELEAFEKAIAGLELIKITYPDKEFIDLKIKRLKQRRANLPGSRGLRK